MKLEIKHLAPYLPYGLRIEHPTMMSGNRKISEMRNLGQTSIEISHRIYVQISSCKPLLRQLSELTKEIEIDGEKFVPITELAKIYETDEIFGHLKFEIKYDFAAVKYVDSEENNIIFCYNFKTKSFGTHDFDNKIIHTVQNQLDLFQKLFEWHFDVFGLIDQGIALPLI